MPCSCSAGKLKQLRWNKDQLVTATKLRFNGGLQFTAALSQHHIYRDCNSLMLPECRFCVTHLLYTSAILHTKKLHHLPDLALQGA
jgi:hypothetical protein